MIISFDLDSTIITSSDEFETEKRNLLGKIIGVERIRKGTPRLIKKLKDEGHSVFIYTTSYRTQFKIWKTLTYYSIKADKIINQYENKKRLEQVGISASKYPPVFYIDIHIDHLAGVKIEGERYNFKTIIISPNEKKLD